MRARDEGHFEVIARRRRNARLRVQAEQCHGLRTDAACRNQPAGKRRPAQRVCDADARRRKVARAFRCRWHSAVGHRCHPVARPLVKRYDVRRRTQFRAAPPGERPGDARHTAGQHVHRRARCFAQQAVGRRVQRRSVQRRRKRCVIARAALAEVAKRSRLREVGIVRVVHASVDQVAGQRQLARFGWELRLGFGLGGRLRGGLGAGRAFRRQLQVQHHRLVARRTGRRDEALHLDRHHPRSAFEPREFKPPRCVGGNRQFRASAFERHHRAWDRLSTETHLAPVIRGRRERGERHQRHCRFSDPHFTIWAQWKGRRQ